MYAQLSELEESILIDNILDVEVPYSTRVKYGLEWSTNIIKSTKSIINKDLNELCIENILKMTDYANSNQDAVKGEKMTEIIEQFKMYN